MVLKSCWFESKPSILPLTGLSANNRLGEIPASGDSCSFEMNICFICSLGGLSSSIWLILTLSLSRKLKPSINNIALT